MRPIAAPISDLVKQMRAVCRAGTICLDSRQISPGDIFVACPGSSSDGRDYIGDAVKRGAVGILYDTALTETQQRMLGDTQAWHLTDLQVQLGALAAAWFNDPAASLTVVAITGTNGKTTTAHWLAAALQRAHVPCGVIGTLGVTGVDGQQYEGVLTTPDVVSLHRSLAQLLAQGATHVVMEASSIGLDQGRLDAVTIDVGVYTNLTPDHLDYHGDMATYAQAKALLFQRPELKQAVINADDAYAQVMTQSCRATIVTYARDSANAGFRAVSVEQTQDAQQFSLMHGERSVRVSTPFVGDHVIANMLAVAGVLWGFGWTLQEIGQSLQQLPAVAGRLELVESIVSTAPAATSRVIVDYAHTPDALRHALKALRPLVTARDGQLWCVVGCGGNRDKQKRPLMAQVAQSGADHVVLTSDNPRNEDPEVILQEMTAGLTDTAKVNVIAERARAILTTVWQAQPNDVVLIAGKGHERYQEVAGVREPFDDRSWAQLALLLKQTPPSVQTDTRQLEPGSLFVALRGERFDGHDYLETAEQAGAIAAIVEHIDETVSLPQIALGPTLAALQIIAAAWRARFDVPVIGVTGSNGKTTTKEMTAAICHQWVGADATLSTVGNLNNEIGVPLTLLRLRPQHRVAVIEMGMNHPGEIGFLASMVQPTVALVLNAQREHQEFMKSVDAVAQENGQVLRALPTHGVAVYPDSDTYSDLWADLSRHVKTRLTFGDGELADVRIGDVESDMGTSQFTLTHAGQTGEFKLGMAGQHNVTNAAAATACTLAAGASLSNASIALSQFSPVKGRMQMHCLRGGQVLIDDTYNANPDSVRVAIDVLAKLPAPRALVLGDMGEVGDHGPQMHKEVGQYARAQAVDYLWTMGQATHAAVDAFGEQARWFASAEALCEHAVRAYPKSVLVKGSRFMAMERVVNQWLLLSDANRDAGGNHAR